MMSEVEIRQRIVRIKDRIEKLQKVISDEMIKHFTNRNMRLLSFAYKERAAYSFVLLELEKVIGEDIEKTF